MIAAHEPISAAADPEPRSPQSDRAREPAHSAASRWIDQHGDTLWRFCKARTGSADAAEEIVQETLLAAMQAHASFSGASSERTWLLGIASHKVADHFRRAAKESGVHLKGCACDRCGLLGTEEFKPDGTWARVTEPWAPPTDDAETKARQLEALRACIANLPPGQRDALWLKDVAGVPSARICKALHLTPTNLWTRLHRARLALRACMEPAMNPDTKPDTKPTESRTKEKQRR